MKPQIAFHSCESTYQDEKYGLHMRVFNSASKKGAERLRYRCTVCGGTRDISVQTGKETS